jgi:predicted outer membrane protein
MIVTAAVYCGSLPTAFPAARQDNTLLDKAVEANVAEIELSKMAEMRAEDPRVKAFAAMMIKDHTKALRQMQHDQDTAQSGASVLSREHRELRDRLSELSGSEFDKAYMDAMVEMHRKDIQEFESAAQSKPSKSDDATSDSSTVTREKPEPVEGAENKPLAKELLPMFKVHLQQATEIQENLQK